MPSPPPQPAPGDTFLVDGEASVQFSRAPIGFSVIAVQPQTTCTGWVWLDGYQLNGHGDAVGRRSIFVRPEGLKPLKPRYRTTAH